MDSETRKKLFGEEDPTDAQRSLTVKLSRQLGVPIPKALTKATASDWISKRIEEQKKDEDLNAYNMEYNDESHEDNMEDDDESHEEDLFFGD